MGQADLLGGQAFTPLEIEHQNRSLSYLVTEFLTGRTGILPSLKIHGWRKIWGQSWEHGVLKYHFLCGHKNKWDGSIYFSLPVFSLQPEPTKDFS